MDIETDGDASKGKDAHLGNGTRIIASFIKKGDLEGEVIDSFEVMRSRGVC